MNPFKLICLTLIELSKQVWSLPKVIANNLQQKREQVARNEQEAERLDRIRNPYRYLGK